MVELECKICRFKAKNLNGLSVHIVRHAHPDWTLKKYYDTFYKQEEGSCLYCGKETKFNGLGNWLKHYNKYCNASC